MTTVNGITLQTRQGVYDAEICAEMATQYYQDRIDYGSLKRVVDIGAHIGAFTCLVRGYASKCEVWAVEMQHDNFALLKANVAPLAGVVAVYAQMWYGRDELHAYRNATNYGNGGLTHIVLPESPAAVPMEVADVRMTLEELCSVYGIESADLLKLDCEGSEWNLLANASRETLRRFKHIVGEWHVFEGQSDFRALCERLTDFEIVHIQDAPDWGQFWLRRRD